MRKLTVEHFFKTKRELYELTLMTEGAVSKRDITVREVNRPGLCLAGHTENFLSERIQVLGETEMSFLGAMPADRRLQALQHMFQFDLNCIILTKSIMPPAVLLQLANEHQVPMFQTPKSTTPFLHVLTEYLTTYFAPRESLHASLVDVYGVGLLFMGRSGIGKSETSLDLVERGHRLVADDLVEAVLKGDAVVMGSGRKLLEHCMEIRGIGVVDIREIFGIRAIRIQKRIEVVVRLEEWDREKHYDRHGLQRATTEVLGVAIPEVIIPIFPGKNITVLAEAVALDHMLRTYGYNAPENLQQRILSDSKARAKLEEYLTNDEE